MPNDGTAVFSTSGKVITFAGFLRAYVEGSDDPKAELADQDNPFRIMPPTFVSLVDLQPFACCCDARAAMDERDAIIYEPRMVFVEDGICFLYQGDAGYEKQEIQPEGPEHRVYMVNDQLEYIRRL